MPDVVNQFCSPEDLEQYGWPPEVAAAVGRGLLDALESELTEIDVTAIRHARGGDEIDNKLVMAMLVGAAGRMPTGLGPGLAFARFTLLGYGALVWLRAERVRNWANHLPKGSLTRTIAQFWTTNRRIHALRNAFAHADFDVSDDGTSLRFSQRRANNPTAQDFDVPLRILTGEFFVVGLAAIAVLGRDARVDGDAVQDNDPGE